MTCDDDLSELAERAKALRKRVAALEEELGELDAPTKPLRDDLDAIEADLQRLAIGEAI